MLYQNEEPLVQRTCIKTANLQSDINTSDKLETQELPPEGLRPKSLPPEELKLQTLICGHQVLTSLSDKSLVSICQKPNMRIQTVGYQPWTVDELRHDAAQTKTGMTGTEELLGKFSFDGQSLPIQVKASTRAIVRTAPNTTRYDIADTLFYEAYRMHFEDVVVK